MELLVSYCARASVEHPTLAAMDVGTLELRFINGVFGAAPDLEIAGLGADRLYVYVAVRRPAALVFLDRPALRLVHHHPLPEFDNLHSLCVRDDELFLVSSGTDEIIRCALRGPRVLSLSVFWRPPGTALRVDAHHLNGLCFFRGELHASGFGKRTGEDWASCADGFIRNVERDGMLVTGLRHPHSPLALDAGIAYCESARRLVHLPGRPPISTQLGYARGLCRVGNHLFVGSSTRRRVSRTTGKPAPGPAGDGPPDRCTISRIPLEFGAVDMMADLSWHGGEIYDLLPLGQS